MKKWTRRDFLQTAAATGALFSTPKALAVPRAGAKILGANSDVRIAVAGLRSKGAQHVEVFGELPGVRIVALCDPDGDILNRETVKLREKNVKADGFRDIRKLLERKDIDALVIATPNHWHSLMSVWACQAGKDVYVEKPVSHNIWEGRKIFEAGRRYNRIVQAGTQGRSDEGLRAALEYVWQGKLGKIKLVRGFCYKRRESIGKVNGPQPIPASVDYDLWTGPAPIKPLMRKELHYDWHWVWDTGNGDIGNQGIHEVDMCRWALREKGFPREVVSIGGRYGYVDDGETPNTQISYFAYETPMIFEVRGLPRSRDNSGMDAYKGVRVGIVIDCENGYFAGGSGGGWIFDNQDKRIQQFKGNGGSAHALNFLQAVRSRKSSELNAAIEGGHISSALCHLANISYRLGKRVSNPDVQKSLAGQATLSESFQRFQDHLSANGVDPSITPSVLGPWLALTPGQERFESREPYDLGFFANRMAKGDYRAPYVIPEKV